ncbi:MULTISPECIES: RNA polymerase sigma factor [unclassified Streptomyces]|uniref:RNA polymerase sigma factor n=1 Tax=unclassified Streptomyces TaxID=2593676 RepID=UPI0036EFA328
MRPPLLTRRVCDRAGGGTPRQARTVHRCRHSRPDPRRHGAGTGQARGTLARKFFRAWRNIDRLPGMEGSVRGWLFTVTRHLIIDWVRQRPQARREIVGAIHQDPSWSSEEFDKVHATLVTKPLLHRLPSQQRAVLVHIYLCDRTIQETAGILGVPAGTVKSRQHNALRRLRATMSSDEAA